MLSGLQRRVAEIVAGLSEASDFVLAGGGAEELAVDKVLAIFGRAEARDFIDLAALEPRFGLDHLCRLALEKDVGFRQSVFLEMLGRFGRLPRDEFDVDDDTFQAIVGSVSRWRGELRDKDPM